MKKCQSKSKTYLIGRHQRVVVHGAASTSTLVHSRVPQGTCLGPILFLYYINDITTNIKSQMRLFADDALITSDQFSQSVTTNHILPNDLHTLEQWANTWDMRFNPCKCYILSMKRAGVKSAIFYRLCGQVLESVTNNPYLGVISTDDFSFSTHVRQVGYVPRPVEHWSSSVATSETVLKNCENLHTPAYADLF